MSQALAYTVSNEFNVLLFGYKQPVWALFETISFDCILLEWIYNRLLSHFTTCKQTWTSQIFISDHYFTVITEAPDTGF